MGKVWCIMGKSASGKDHLYKRLLADEDLQLKKVVPYTTRPIRSDEIPGESYIFSTEEDVARIEAEGKMIELRAYDTIHGVWKYFTVDDGQIDFNTHDSLLIGTLESYAKIRQYFGKENVVPLYINVEDGERLERALRRERKQEEPKYAEMCRRFLADDKDFSEEKKAECEIQKEFENDDKDRVYNELKQYILSYK